jgi:hypothetical protein
MGTPFPQEVTAGGQLIVPQIYSPNFNLADQTGWAIMSNGDAYFFNLTAAGSVTANTVVVKGSGDGLFIYTGTPGPGTLVLAATSASGTDMYGNYFAGPGISVSGPGGNAEIQIRPDKNAILVYG